MKKINTLPTEVEKMKISYMPFSMRTRNRLLSNDIRTVGELYSCFNNNKLKSFDGVGECVIKEIRKYFHLINLLMKQKNYYK